MENQRYDGGDGPRTGTDGNFVRRFTFNPDMDIAPKTFSAPGVAATVVARPQNPLDNRRSHRLQNESQPILFDDDEAPMEA